MENCILTNEFPQSMLIFGFGQKMVTRMKYRNELGINKCQTLDPNQDNTQYDITH